MMLLFTFMLIEYKCFVLEVTVLDEADITASMQCRAVCDPHMTLFDGRTRWEGQWTGEYVLYRNVAEDSEVSLLACFFVSNSAR